MCHPPSLSGLLALVVCLLATLPVAAAEDPAAPPAADAVPDWFDNPDDPDAIYRAWRQLTTREAAVYWHLGGWKVIAGRLVDAQGEPLAHTPIIFEVATHIRSRKVYAQTDGNGSVIIYGVSALDETSPGVERLIFWVFPGFPATHDGRAYAQSIQAGRPGEARLIAKAEDRAFYRVTCDAPSEFDQAGFAAFVEAQDRKYALWHE